VALSRQRSDIAGEATPQAHVARRAARALHDSTAAHGAAVQADLSGDAETAGRLYRKALRLRPEQWESSLRLGTLNLRLDRSQEAEDALRHTIALGEQRPHVDLCAARTNLGVLLFSASSAATAPGQQREAASWAAEALGHYELAAAAGTCNSARLNAARAGHRSLLIQTRASSRKPMRRNPRA
jgi:Flp pilus assembly protein TadD